MNAKDKILTAALELFVSKGYNETTIERIARHGNISKGLVYYYYQNKQVLLSHIMETVDIDEKKISDPALDAMSLEEVFNYYLKLYYEYFYTLKTICQEPWEKILKFYLEALNVLPEYLDRVSNRRYKMKQYIKKRLISEHGFTEENAEHRALLFLAALDGMMYNFIYTPGLTIEDYAEIPKRIFICQ